MSQQPALNEWTILSTSLVAGIDTVVYPMFNLPLSQPSLYVENYGELDFVHILRQFERDMHRVRGICIPIFNDLYYHEYGQHFTLDLSPMSCGRDFMATAQQQGLEPTLLTAVPQLRECLMDPDIRNTLENIKYLLLVAGACLALTDGFRAMRCLPRVNMDDVASSNGSWDLEWNLLASSLIDGIDTVVYPMFHTPLSATSLDMGDGYELAEVDFALVLRQFERDMHHLRAMCIPVFNALHHTPYHLNPTPMVYGREFMATAQEYGLEPSLLTAVSELRECLMDPDIRHSLENIHYLLLVAGACLALTDGFRAMRGLSR
jgi:hypothetical protein